MMNTKYSKIALLLATATSMTLAGCGGDDGKPGNPGNPGGEPAEAIKVLNLEITNVSYTDGKPVVEVFATNEEDLPVIGLKDIVIENAAQLIPQGAAGAGASANWQKLGSSKSFEDKKNGNYIFTFDTFDSEKFNAQLTQRFNVVSPASTLIDGVTPVAVKEIVRDFDGEGYQAKYTKNIVSAAACASCHAEGEKIYHKATSVETCITCHTQEWADGRGKPEVAFAHLVHNVHNSNKAWGRNNNTAETAHAIVQDNCQTCHVESEELTEWGNWTRIPTMETCTSCHTNIDFKAGKGHSQQLDNSNCIACHNASWTEELHTGDFVQKKALINAYDISVESNIDSTTKAATISVQAVDANGVKIDLETLLPMIQRFEIVTNVGPNNVTLGYYGKDSQEPIKNGSFIEGSTAAFDNGKLVYTTSKDLKLGAEGSDNETAFSFVGWSLCSEDGEFVECSKVVKDENMDTSYDGTKFLNANFYTAMKYFRQLL